MIAIAGSTGWGGIGFGLNTDGQVVDPGRANNHLHFFLTYWDGTQWATIDPYGAYTDVSTGCYELGAETEYKRLFAPFYPDHIGVPAAIHGHYQDYYPAMGLALQTASVYQTPRGLEVAGSYQGGLDSLWLAGLGRTQEQFQTLFDDADALGLTPRELSTVIDGETLLFNGIFSERTEPGGWTVLGDTDAQFSETWNNAELAGGRIAEHFVYEFGAVRRHAAVVKVDGVNPWQTPWEYSFSDFDNFVDTQVLSGFVPVSVNVEQPASNTYGGVFLQAQGDWAIDVDVPVAGLQAVHNQRIAEGRRLYKIQGYNGGETFSVIYVAGEQRPQAVVRGPFALACGGSEVTLDGSASTFDSAFPIFYEWSGPFGVIKGQNPSPTVTLAAGTHTLQLRVFDSRGFQSIASQTVTIEAGAQRYEAENMFASTGGPAPGGWNIWSNGYVSTNHTFTAGATSITVRARGEIAGGVAPHMVVSVGGVPIGNVSVTSTTFADYTFSYNAVAGSREIRVAFDNDFYSPPQDR
ncbi:MAG TPA: carbohydrate-binding domain-containing protein, partial [Candidatus Eisenbacteria bacterium]|nr:carbohydrate-binding domain-containing protein [Candidatus Eisenbacteria bacterium]